MGLIKDVEGKKKIYNSLHNQIPVKKIVYHEYLAIYATAIFN